MNSVENVRAVQELTDTGPPWGMTAYFEAGGIVTSDEARWAYEDLISRDQAGDLTVRVGGFILDPYSTDDPLAVAAELTCWSRVTFGAMSR